MSLPLVLLILDVYPLRRLRWGNGTGRTEGASAWGVWLEKLAFLGLSLPFMAAAIRAKGGGQCDPAGRAGWGSPRASPRPVTGACFYLVKTFFPRLGSQPTIRVPNRWTGRKVSTRPPASRWPG